jgi:hypothetical protein
MNRLVAGAAIVMLAFTGSAALAQNKPGDKPGAIGNVEGKTQLPSYKLGNEGSQPANRDNGNAEAPAMSGDSSGTSAPMTTNSYHDKVQACRTEGEFRQNLSGNALQAFVAKCVGG